MNGLWIVMCVVMGTALAQSATDHDWGMFARLLVITLTFFGGFALDRRGTDRR